MVGGMGSTLPPDERCRSSCRNSGSPGPRALGERPGDHALTEIHRFQMADKPPSTFNSTPFTKLESSEARNNATVAISSG